MMGIVRLEVETIDQRSMKTAIAYISTGARRLADTFPGSRLVGRMCIWVCFRRGPVCLTSRLFGTVVNLKGIFGKLLMSLFEKVKKSANKKTDPDPSIFEDSDPDCKCDVFFDDRLYVYVFT